MKPLKWWQSAVFYQIYPRSFADSNGDGIGDFEGIISHLDDLQDLGVEGIWLSPHYPSPLWDCGYDVADYVSVAPEYGDLSSFRRFLDESHRRGMRVILDFVLNHTSDQHPWFIESRSSRDHPRRDWYIWRDGHFGRPPNNWSSDFEDSAWEFDPLTCQYYYHFFFRQQPDLNWRNPAVKEAMFDVMRFWLELGVDGYRLDAVETIFEDPALTNHEANISHAELYHAYHTTYPGLPDDAELLRQRRLMFAHQEIYEEVHPLLQEMKALVSEYPERVLVAETDDVDFYGDGENEMDLVFNFPLIRTERLTPSWILQNQSSRLGSLPPKAWPCNTLGNHDSARAASQFGDGSLDSLKALAAVALLLPGTPFLYYGEEIGMSDYDLPKLEQIQDQLARWMYRTEVEIYQSSPSQAFQSAKRYGRDRCRTPMQWRNGPQAGFCEPSVQPWLPVNPNYAQGINVMEQRLDPHSLWNCYRELIALRRSTPALLAGDFFPLEQAQTDCLCFLRRSEEQTCIVAINLAPKPTHASLQSGVSVANTLLAFPGPQISIEGGRVSLDPFAVWVAEAAQSPDASGEPLPRKILKPLH